MVNLYYKGYLSEKEFMQIRECGYLLVAGIIFITIASYNEWSKQRESEGKLISKMKQLVKRLKEWN
ncbi:hypothetical protein [Gracilibacillus boraciitolerans]|uniref:hypothetical protein n=1 Tax=Gracilibacillus boraciitolerans TaxID=307521 RepID=UPI001F343A5A|nr:hypothetical protein [Gracilibacillus boraciitolerans]